MILEGEHPVEVDGWLIPGGRVIALDDDDRCWLREPDPDGGLPWLAIVRHGHIVGAGLATGFTATIDALQPKSVRITTTSRSPCCVALTPPRPAAATGTAIAVAAAQCGLRWSLAVQA